MASAGCGVGAEVVMGVVGGDSSRWVLVSQAIGEDGGSSNRSAMEKQ